jgi:hypothetical protein
MCGFFGLLFVVVEVTVQAVVGDKIKGSDIIKVCPESGNCFLSS